MLSKCSLFNVDACSSFCHLPLFMCSVLHLFIPNSIFMSFVDFSRILSSSVCSVFVAVYNFMSSMYRRWLILCLTDFSYLMLKPYAVSFKVLESGLRHIQNHSVLRESPWKIPLLIGIVSVYIFALQVVRWMLVLHDCIV